MLAKCPRAQSCSTHLRLMGNTSKYQLLGASQATQGSGPGSQLKHLSRFLHTERMKAAHSASFGIRHSTIWSLPRSPTTFTLYPNFNETFLLRTHHFTFQSLPLCSALLWPRWHYILLEKAGFGVKQKWLKSQLHYYLFILGREFRA